jgi:hypothetical protein
MKEFKTIQGWLSFALLGLIITDCATGIVNPSKQQAACWIRKMALQGK